MVSGSEDWVAGDVLAPVVEGHAPRVSAGMRTERGQSVKFRLPGEPSAVLLANRSVGCLDLSVVKDGFAKDQVAVRCPGEVVEGVVRILAAEPGKDGLPVVGLPVAVGILEEGHVRFLGDVDPTITELEGKRYVQSFGPNRAFVRLAILIDVLEDDDFIIRGPTGVDVRVGRGATDPQPA